MLKYLLSISKIKKIKIVEKKNRIRPLDADLQIPDSKKFRKLTKWKPKIKFEQIMLDLLNYWRHKVRNKNFLDR